MSILSRQEDLLIKTRLRHEISKRGLRPGEGVWGAGKCRRLASVVGI
jgi:Trm5-related predicted tRNA methylase